jgi:hypothetical protein
MSTHRQLSLSEVQEAFRQWRVHRQPRHVPDTLREQAVGLLKTHRIGEVVNGLGIKHQMLHRWKWALADPIESSPDSGTVFLPLPEASPALPVVSGTEPLSPLTLTHHAVDGSAYSLAGSLSLEQWRVAVTLLACVEGVQ